MNILEIKNLSVEYKTSSSIVGAVKNVSFNVKKGETFVIVGRSGSGKSTVASAIMDLTGIDGGKIKSGSIFYRGKDLLKMTFDEKRVLKGSKISMIFQDPQSYLNPVIKVGKQIAESFTIHNSQASNDEIRKRVDEALKKVKLDDTERIFNSYPHQLSGGQKQRVLIAMAIMNNPEFLIADEPTTGLDASIQKQILDLINELKNTLGLTLIMITHNMRIARRYSDTMAVMHNGEIVEIGNTEEIFKNPKHEYTKLLINV
ncbi:MAG: ABC transporter ATP-binding protein [Endomicrobia bacterium]|nr:ABC transporter ATP-binding protein [Endomicrobiia bacterium]MCL2506136.1 ABC transporter ATP-binding protein [Endomicrobiia bacterium]